MKKIRKLISLILAAMLTLALIPCFSSQAASEYAGSVYQCKLDENGTLTISGTLEHKVATQYKDAELVLYRMRPWESTTAAIKDGTPIKRAAMSMRFEFKLSCDNVADRLSMYVVALQSNSETLIVAPPKYADCESAPPASDGFKGVNTKDHVTAVNSDASSAIVDVELDKLQSQSRNGYFYTVDGVMFYFDRSYIDSLDKAVRSYCAAGANVYLRLLLPSDGAHTEFSVDNSVPAMYKSIYLRSDGALVSLYAHVYFLCERYGGGADGKISGLIIGRGLNEPLKYNYSVDVGDGYCRMIASAFTVVGAAAYDASGGTLSLVLPVTDKMAGGEPDFQSFVMKIGDYLSERTTLRIAVMAESTHNPYGLYDDYFYVEDTGDVDADFTTPAPEETSAPETERPSEPETSAPDETVASPETTASPETSASPETTVSPDTEDEETQERLPPTPTPDGAPYFCADSTSIFLDALDRVSAKSDAVCKEYLWCWYPDENTVDAALGVCYSYGYMSLAAAGASAFFVSFADVGGYGISSISHLFKHIDTKTSHKETSYSLSVFGVGSWSDVIFGVKSTTGIYREVIEPPMTSGEVNCKGSVNIWDFTSQSGADGWYGGFNCSSLKSVTGGSGKYLKASLLAANAGEYADIGYIGASSNLALYCDSISFDLACPGEQNEIFEIMIRLYTDKESVEAKTTVRGGERAVLTIDTSEISTDATVDSMRLCAKRVTGEGDYELQLYKVSINSMKYSSSELSAVLDAARDDLLGGDGDGTALGRALTAVAVLATASLFTVALTMTADKKRKNNTSKKKGN